MMRLCDTIDVSVCVWGVWCRWCGREKTQTTHKIMDENEFFFLGSFVSIKPIESECGSGSKISNIFCMGQPHLACLLLYLLLTFIFFLSNYWVWETEIILTGSLWEILSVSVLLSQPIVWKKIFEKFSDSRCINLNIV